MFGIGGVTLRQDHSDVTQHISPPSNGRGERGGCEFLDSRPDPRLPEGKANGMNQHVTTFGTFNSLVVCLARSIDVVQIKSYALERLSTFNGIDDCDVAVRIDTQSV
jgi:hypothetical protein